MTRRLPNDVSRCPGTRCEVRESCARNMAEARDPVPVCDFSTLGPLVTCAAMCGNFIKYQIEVVGNAPHEVTGAALSRTVNLDAVVGHRSKDE